MCVHRRHLVILWEMFSLVRLLLALHCWGLNNEKLKSCCSCGRFKYKGCRLKIFLAKFGKSAFFYGHLQNSLLPKQLFPMTNVSHSHLHVCLWPVNFGKVRGHKSGSLKSQEPPLLVNMQICVHIQNPNWAQVQDKRQYTKKGRCPPTEIKDQENVITNKRNVFGTSLGLYLMKN